MRVLSETTAIAKAHELKRELQTIIREQYEHRAKSCLTCETKGACCLDAHFVNVRITRLEATAIRNVINSLPEPELEKVRERITNVIEKFDLSDDPLVEKTYACPLFEPNIGCLVHEQGKPLPCIVHACYENRKDLPPEDLLEKYESKVDDLNQRAYGSKAVHLSLPIAVSNAMKKQTS